jgi:hypothetical protein
MDGIVVLVGVATEPAPTPSWDQIAKTASSSLSKICPAIEAAAGKFIARAVLHATDLARKQI